MDAQDLIEIKTKYLNLLSETWSLINGFKTLRNQCTSMISQCYRFIAHTPRVPFKYLRVYIPTTLCSKTSL